MNIPMLTPEALQLANAVVDHTRLFAECFRHPTRNPASLIAHQLVAALKANRSGAVTVVQQAWAVKTGHKPFDANTDLILAGNANDSTYMARKIRARGALDGDGQPETKQKADLVSFGSADLKAFGQWVIDTIQALPRAQTEPMQAYVFFTRVHGVRKPFGALITDMERNVVDMMTAPDALKQQAMQVLSAYVSREGDLSPHWAGEVRNGHAYVALPELAALLEEAGVTATLGKPLA